MPTRDEELLIRIRKLLESKATSDLTREAWQEHLTRDASVPASRSLQAAEVIAGFAGSWAASGNFESAISVGPDPSNGDQTGYYLEGTPARRQVETRLGKPGLPEINFAPYNWNTQRSGPNGPSLLGHPISFSVVGPTAKSPFTNWQFSVLDNSGTPGVGDTLALEAGPTGTVAASLEEAYSITGGISAYNGGLYILITDDGSRAGAVVSGDNGLTPLADHANTARFEIFRVLSFTGSTLTLAPTKRLATYFTIPGADPVIRSIMLLQPHVTRLVAMPGSGAAVGRERIFAMVPPILSANDDLYPPYGAAGGGPDGTWRRGGFESTDTAGEIAQYNGGVALPVPVPTRTMTGRVEEGAGTPADGPGIWRITDIVGSPVIGADQNKVVHIYEVKAVDDANYDDFDSTASAILGWYEVFETIGSTGYQLKRIAQVNPETGKVFFGPGPFFNDTGATATSHIVVEFTLHDSIADLFAGTLDIDAVEAARLRNLINPAWVERTSKLGTTAGLPVGASPARADRAIFDTSGDGQSAYANPGSLLDLGFRMVLFASKDAGGTVIPDFDNPITSRNIVIDPAITTESQFIEIDYSAGMVFLSHDPPGSATGDIVPNGILGTGDNNPRGEVVLWAACVPYSMEPGQIGAGTRISGGALLSADTGQVSTPLEAKFSQGRQQDIWSSFTYAVVTGSGGAGPAPITITCTGDGSGWPATGTFEMVLATNPFGTSEGLVYYESIGNITSTSFDFQSCSTDATLPFTVGGTVAVLRRGAALDHMTDATYGAAKRNPIMRLAYADLYSNEDGSITVMPTAVQGPAEELRGAFPIGTSSEIARLYLDAATQNWTAASPPWAALPTTNEIGLEVLRGRIVASMSEDFGQGDITFERFINRIDSATIIQTGVADSIPHSPSNRVTLAVDEADATFMTVLPAADMTGLSAVIEGGTYVSGEQSTWTPPAAGERFLIDFKTFGNPSLTPSVKTHAEGPANPLNWFAHTAAGVDSPTTITTAINAHYAAQTPAFNPCELTGTAGTERMLFSGRQVRVLPSKPIIESRAINVGTPFGSNADSAMVLTAYSADPKNGNGAKWVTIHFPRGAFTSTDPNAVAAYLNQALYDTVHGDYVGNRIEDAGFHSTPTATAASVNPWLSGGDNYGGAVPSPSGAPVDERQFLFIGPDDPRHPDSGAETVCLICGGWGTSTSSGTSRDFYNVMVVTGKTLESVSGQDIATELGGEFDPGPPFRPPACGLFFGDHALDIPASPPSATTDFGNGAGHDPEVLGTLNESVGFTKDGADPLAALIGSHRIVQTLTAPLRVEITVEYGHGSQHFKGPQATAGNVYDVHPDGGLIAQVDFWDAMTYLGRWTQPLLTRPTINLATAGAAGLAHIWTTYGVSEHDEMGFTTPLRATTQAGYESFLLQFSDAASNLSSPTTASGSPAPGDLILASTVGSTWAFDGVVVDYDSVAGTGAAMCFPRGAYSTNLGQVAESAQPSITGVFSATALPSAATAFTSLVPRPGFGALTTALRSLYSNTAGASTTTSDDWGQGLDGGSAPGTGAAKLSGVMMGGGRIHMLSMFGPNAPAGLILSQGVVGENVAASLGRLSSTFIEQGVFTTSLTLNRGFNPLEAQLDSAGIYDVLTDDEGPTPYISAGRGQSGHGSMVGGVGGVRISGDAHIWMRGLHRLGHTGATALVRSIPGLSARNENMMTMGPVTAAGDNVPGAHMPSGFGAKQNTHSGDNTAILYAQEATVVLGLTRMDLVAFLAASGNDEWPATADLTYTGVGSAALFSVANSAAMNTPVPLEFLAGLFVHLEAPTGSGTDASNTGVWRIVGTPQVTLGGSSLSAGGGGNFLNDQFPSYGSLLAGNAGSVSAIAGISEGGIAPSAVIAVIQMRVERYTYPPALDSGATNAQSFQTETADGPLQGHPWQIFANIEATEAVYVAEVVDPGGSPTGAPNGLHGITLDPGSLGRSTLSMDLVPVFHGTTVTNKWALMGAATLYGIRESSDNRGRVVSHAVFSMPGAIPGTIDHDSYARAVIHSSQRDDGADAFGSASAQGEFVIDNAGRVSYVGHPTRLGPGIMMDGGLGLVMGTAWRSTPKPAQTEHLGRLAIFGQGAGYPLASYTRNRSQSGPSVASTFNHVEFYEDATIVGPRGMLLFEDARAASGLPYRLRENIAAAEAYASAMKKVWARTKTSGGTVHAHISTTPNDALFPYTTAGIKFRAPGGVIYERPFRPMDARGGSQQLKSLTNDFGRVGIRGMEIPAHGEALLLPKGPPNINQDPGEVNFGNTITGATALDRPLYEFNGAHSSVASTDFPISPQHCFTASEQAKGPDPDDGPALHNGIAGILSQSYRHSNSRENAAAYTGGSATSEQMRILDGMIIEDVTNGTFYTAGSVGRWKAFTDITASLGEPGDGTRSPVTGSVTVAHGGVASQVEIVYDIHEYVDLATTPVSDSTNGFGDRVDNGSVRRPLKGHAYRVTPNVEFVPILGPRGGDGGLLPPYTDRTDATTAIEGADALFYSLSKDFLAPGGVNGAGDIGRFIYICGTEQFHYTGWWLIMDVLASYTVQTHRANEFTLPDTSVVQNVAVLRKWRRSSGVGATGLSSADWRGTLPLGFRAPRVRMSSDKRTNDVIMSGVANQYGDLDLWITNNAGASFYTATRTQAQLNTAVVTTTTNLVAHLNGNADMNGTTSSYGVAFITWTAPDDSTVIASYNLALLSASEQQNLTGHGAMLRVQWLSNNTGTHAMPGAGSRDDDAIGFYSFDGHSSQLDRASGDKNNAALMVDNSQHAQQAGSMGLRWVFSAPLTEENVGSYMHLTKPRLFRFGQALTSQGAGADGALWTSGNPRSGDTYSMTTDIFRINRCLNTTSLVLGGDCETYHPEIMSINASAYPGPTDPGKGRPIAYSPLGVYGHWPDSTTGILSTAVGGALEPLRYSLQPIARERIVSINPSSGRSNTLMSTGDANIDGTGPKIAYNQVSSVGFDISEPWRLMGRHDVASTGITSEEQYNTEGAAPTYVWAPAGEWWQLWLPAPGEQGTETEAQPTLRLDLTEAFTQAMQPGAGINSPFPGHEPKGVRLNRIWVNCGLWGQAMSARTAVSIPGYKGTGPVQDAAYMSFNLVVELPGGHTRTLGTNDHPRGHGSGAMPFGGRAPNAIYSHPTGSTAPVHGGTVVVPLYCNREAGDLFPNVMERFVSGGPENTPAMPDDWVMGDYEFGFGCSSAGGAHPAGKYDLHSDQDYTSNPGTPVLWGGINYDAFTSVPDVLAMSSIFPRLSRTGGGVESHFTSGMEPDNEAYDGATPRSNCAATLTGLTLAHPGQLPGPPTHDAGTAGTGDATPSTAGHAFMIALTPVGDDFTPPSLPTDPTTDLGEYGRALETSTEVNPVDRQFKVGNWLDKILEHYGMAAPSGSMLPVGARVFLEITVGTGDLTSFSMAGCWVGGVKCSFEVETADGTAYSENVNILGDNY